MKVLAAVILVLFVLSGSLFGWRILPASDTYIVGGQLVIPAGRVIHGNLQALFAQVTLEDGARVDGGITAVSSTLDLAGSVGESLLVVGSDVTVRTTAQLAASPRRIAGIPYVILLPGMLRTGDISR